MNFSLSYKHINVCNISCFNKITMNNKGIFFNYFINKWLTWINPYFYGQRHENVDLVIWRYHVFIDYILTSTYFRSCFVGLRSHRYILLKYYGSYNVVLYLFNIGLISVWCTQCSLNTHFFLSFTKSSHISLTFLFLKENNFSVMSFRCSCVYCLL